MKKNHAGGHGMIAEGYASAGAGSIQSRLGAPKGKTDRHSPFFRARPPLQRRARAACNDGNGHWGQAPVFYVILFTDKPL